MSNNESGTPAPEAATPPREPDEAVARITEAARMWADARESRTHREVTRAYDSLVHTIKCEVFARARAAAAVPAEVREEIAVAARHRRELSQDGWVLPEDAKHFAALADALDAWLAATAPALTTEGAE